MNSSRPEQRRVCPTIGWRRHDRGWELADFIAVRPDSVRTAGCRPNQLLFSAAATDVRHVVVHGEHIVEDGLHRAGDVAAHLTSALKVLREAPA